MHENSHRSYSVQIEVGVGDSAKWELYHSQLALRAILIVVCNQKMSMYSERGTSSKCSNTPEFLCQ